MEDDWESPTLGAWGLGWERWCDGMEVSQFTYFQQVAGFECAPEQFRMAEAACKIYLDAGWQNGNWWCACGRSSIDDSLAALGSGNLRPLLGQ